MSEFICVRTSRRDDKPCEEAYEKEFLFYTNCTAKTVEEAKKHEWVRNGLPVQKDGFVRVFRADKEKVWCVNISSIESMIEFVGKYGKCVIFNHTDSEDILLKIEIYDYYRE
jgi:hypothetical protein